MATGQSNLHLLTATSLQHTDTSLQIYNDHCLYLSRRIVPTLTLLKSLSTTATATKPAAQTQILQTLGLCSSGYNTVCTSILVERPDP